MRRALILLTTLFISCSSPLCGCSPRMAGVVIDGVLRSSTGIPRAGMRVEGEVATQSCTSYTPMPEHAISQPDGRVRLELFATPADSFCLRLIARDTAVGSPSYELPVVLRVRGRYPPFDTVTGDLFLPP